MHCTNCSANNEASAKFCHACGSPLTTPDPGTMRTPGTSRSPATPTGKNPVLAALCSAIIPGVGQFYNGDAKKGLTMLVAAVIFGTATAGALWFVVAAWSAVDGYRVANGTGKAW
jgi:TM2 domain-containing membrane protein YozV